MRSRTITDRSTYPPQLRLHVLCLAERVQAETSPEAAVFPPRLETMAGDDVWTLLLLAPRRGALTAIVGAVIGVSRSTLL